MVESGQAPVVTGDREASVWRRIRDLIPIVVFAVTVSFADALRTVPPVYLKAARNMGSDGMDLILRVTVPAALPHLISAAKIGWSFAWRSLIGAEVIFATVGLGFLVNQGRDNF